MKKPKSDRVLTDGPWNAVPIRFMRSRRYCELSPQAVKMFWDLVSQLNPGARGNGDLSMPWKTMQTRGWKSEETGRAALAELERQGLLVVSRRGDRRRCHLYALTLWPLSCDLKKIDIRPGAYSMSDWRADLEDSAAPTEGAPAVVTPVRSADGGTVAVGKVAAPTLARPKAMPRAPLVAMSAKAVPAMSPVESAAAPMVISLQLHKFH